MKRLRLTLALALASLSGLPACGLFEDPTPSNIFLEMRAPAGEKTRVIYSQRFVAGVTDAGVTQVQVFGTDTVIHTMPFDTVIDISAERRWFVQAESLDGDTLTVSVTVDVDDRNLVDETGFIFPDTPWQFVYAFNQEYTRFLAVEF